MHPKPVLSGAAPLRVLCAQNWLDEGALRAFSARTGVPIQLWTYSRPSELLQQMANSDGSVDVVCTSSLLLKGLIQSHWIKKTDYSALRNLELLSVDFLHLPFDPELEYSVPLFWNLYGFFGKGENAQKLTSWKQTWDSKRVSLWGEELQVLDVLNLFGLKIEEGLQQEEVKSLEEKVRAFVKTASQILKPQSPHLSAEALIAKSDFIQLPLSRVARLVGENSPYQFWLPEDGGTIEVGLLAVGEKSVRPELARELINALISSEHALGVHKRLGAGVVHASLGHLSSIAPLQKPQALRRFPLNRFRFPDLNVEALPRFQKIYDESLAASNRN